MIWPEPNSSASKPLAESTDPSWTSGARTAPPSESSPKIIPNQVGMRPASLDPMAGTETRPPMSCWLTPAMMNSPIPEPTPHFEMTSSM